MIKILMISRSTLNTSKGGDTIQVLETASYLRRLGVEVDIKLSNEPIEYQNYHLIHFFNIIRPADILKHIERSNLPFVVSTIFVDYEEYEKKFRKGIVKVLNKFLSSDSIEYFKAIARFFKNGERVGSMTYLRLGHRRAIKHIATKAAMLLPNSENEYRRFSAKYEINQRYAVIPNAINREYFGHLEENSSDTRWAVICVARIEALKNQLNVILALNSLGLPGYIIGNPSLNSQAYYQECKEQAGPNITFISHLSQNELTAYYRKSKVHVLASWFETTGLSSLEAAVMGCNIVVSPKGDTTEYFKDFAAYCDPGSVESIKSAIQEAYQKENDGSLRNYVLENYTWEKTAETTLSAYKQVLNIG